MAQYIKQPNLWGNIGQNFAAGLAGQMPKEVERYRLSQGLQNIGQQQNMSPFQQFSALSAVPGITPQMVQSGAELLRQQAIGQGLANQANIQNQPRQNPFQKAMIQQQEAGGPSITTAKGIEAAKQHYIPPSLTDIQARAGQLYEGNRQLYPTPDLALAAAKEEASLLDAQNKALQARRQSEKGLLNDLKSSLQGEAERRGVKIPANEYTKLENEAKQKFLPKSEGGEGLTEEQIKDEIGKKADDISRDYQNLKNLGPGLILGRETRETLRSMESLRQKYAERGELENFADTLVSDLKLSPQVAAYYAYPVKDNPEISKMINSLPELKNRQLMEENQQASFDDIERIRAQKTSDISAKIASKMGKNDSPMAIAMYLKSKNYDPYEFLTYLRDNRKKLGLTEAQGRELDKPQNFGPNLSDNWMLFSTGLDKLVEQ